MRTSAIVIILLLMASIITFAPITAAPAEVWVDDDGPDNGTDHFDTIQEGINAVDAGGTVHVAAGTYTLSATITILKNISLLGAGADVTFIDGNNSVQVLYTSGLDTSAIIDGFTIRNSNTSLDGGGMFNQSSSPTVTNCTFSNNTAYSGAGMFNQSSSPTVTNCTFSNNTATSTGGGMYNWTSGPSTASDTAPVVTNCTFSNNSAAYAGGMGNLYSMPTITNCTFSNNSATVNSGALNISSSDSTVTNCTFLGNTAITTAGGIGISNTSNMTITGCTFTGNSSNTAGGIANMTTPAVITNCTFSGNSAVQWGGAIVFGSCTPFVSNCTFSNNTANQFAGGIYNQSATPTITNCIMWGDSINEIFNSNSTPTVTYSDIEGGYSGTGNINANPLLANASSGDLRLYIGSPCIDTGTDTSAPAFGSVIDDILGILRPQGSAYDMGAYEGGIEKSNSWSGPVVMKPLVTVMLSKASAIWECIQEALPEALPEGVADLLDEVQDQMSKAAVLSNPVYASGQLNIAFELLREVNDLLSCGCYPV